MYHNPKLTVSRFDDIERRILRLLERRGAMKKDAVLGAISMRFSDEEVMQVVTDLLDRGVVSFVRTKREAVKP